MSSPLAAIVSAERPRLSRAEMTRLVREANERFGLVVIKLALVEDPVEREVVARVARRQLRAVAS